MATKQVKSQGIPVLVDTRTATGISPDVYVFTGNGQGRTSMSVVAGTGAVTATVEIQGSLNGTDFFVLATHTCSGTTKDVKGANIAGNWKFIRSEVTAISGTGAEVNIYVGG